MKLRVCQIMHNIYSHAFDEVRTMLVACLRELGHDVEEANHDLSRSRLNIILGANLLEPHQNLYGYAYVCWQFEQLFDESPWWKMGKLEPVLRHAYAVWDYSPQNIQFLSQRGIPALHLPVGYHDSLKTMTLQPPVYDALFYGARPERRIRILKQIAELPQQPQLCLVYGGYGAGRDKFIEQSLINLNIHQYDTNVFEAVRVSYLLNNGCLVVSEESEAYPYSGVDIPMAPAAGLPALCAQFLDDCESAVRRRELCAEQFRDLYPMKRFLKEVIGGTASKASNAA
jgi:hypothetical protein